MVGLLELSGQYLGFEGGLIDLICQRGYGGSGGLKITCHFPKLGGLMV